MKLFLPNLSFEDELSGKTEQQSERSRRTLRDLSPLMGLLGQAGDVVLTDCNVDAMELPACLRQVSLKSTARLPRDHRYEVIPWGWTSRTKKIACEFGRPTQQIPALEAVRSVNSRAFSANFDQVDCADPQALPFGPAGFGVLCHEIGEWKAAVTTLHASGCERWVAKPGFSHAGRNRLLASGLEINQQQRGWLLRQLQTADGVYVEPWQERMEEAGLQFHISPPPDTRPRVAAEIELCGVAELQNDHVGRYLGSVIHHDPRPKTQWEPAIRHGRIICEAAAAAGYFGPIGIDCFRFRTPDGGVATRLCNDINARCTMGRLALQLRALLQPGQSGMWCGFATPRFSDFVASMRKTLGRSGFRNLSATVTSPDTIEGHPTGMGTVLFVGDDVNQLIQLTETLRRTAKD